MGNCAGKDAVKVMTNTDQQPAKEADDNEEPQLDHEQQPTEGDDKETVNEPAKEKATDDVVVKQDDEPKAESVVPNNDENEVEIPDMEVIGKKVNIKAEIQATANDEATNEEEPKMTESEAEEMEENKSEPEEQKEDQAKEEEADVAELTDAVATATIEPMTEDQNNNDVQEEDVAKPEEATTDETAEKKPKDEWVQILDPDQVRKEWMDKDKENVPKEANNPILQTPNAEPEPQEKKITSENNQEIPLDAVHED